MPNLILIKHAAPVVTPNVPPEKYADHMITFHSPIIAAPRLNAKELVEVAKEVGKRLQHTKGNAVFMIPLRGTSRYGVEGGPLRRHERDQRHQYKCATK